MPVRELSSAPGMATLYARALAGSTVLPALRRLPGAPVPAGRELPDLELALSDVAPEREHLAAYDRVCGFRLRDKLPPTYPHVLAFPLAMQLMTDPDFPFPVIGLVHVRNRIAQLRPIALEERLELRVRAAELRPHERGTQFDVVAEASVDGEPAWRGWSTYLHRASSGGSREERREERPSPPEPRAVWRVAGDTGRRYAAVSGDANPIHMHPLSARLFGMSRPIAHGMWTKARCLAALEGTLPDACEVDVAFKLPIPLPGRVAFASRPEDGGRAFSVWEPGSGKPHLEGSVKPA